jgi:putative ABC transport system ATP-binding protein
VSPPLFAFEHVSVRGEERPRLDDVTVTVPDGALTVLVGPSGSGKSTFVRLCNRLEIPDAGTVRYRGADLADLDPPAHRRRVGMLFQAPVPLPGTVLDNLRVGAPALDAAGAARLLERVHLDPGLADRDAASLSGGESQRMCLARALATGPEALLLDEPTAALDAEPRRALEALVRDLCDQGVPAVWVTHDLAQMDRLADHVIVLMAGQLVHTASGRPFSAGAPPVAAEFLEARA